MLFLVGFCVGLCDPIVTSGIRALVWLDLIVDYEFIKNLGCVRKFGNKLAEKL